jgi:hypothetical protein
MGELDETLLDETLLCLLRKKKVKATPEEIVRQRWLHHMVKNLGFPLLHMAIEKSLDALLDVPSATLPNRRPDLVVFASGIHPTHALYPLLLLEFKKGEITKEAIDQVRGYYFFVKAPFFAVCGPEKICFGGANEEVLNFLPSYNQLLTAALSFKK